MANKARYYGIGTKNAIDKRNTASPNFHIKDELTRDMVDGAIVSLSITNPSFDKLTTQVAAQKIKSLLQDRGFRGELSIGGGKISDTKGNTFALTHANNDKGQIVVGTENHDKTDEKKKK